MRSRVLGKRVEADGLPAARQGSYPTDLDRNSIRGTESVRAVLSFDVWPVSE